MLNDNSLLGLDNDAIYIVLTLLGILIGLSISDYFNYTNGVYVFGSVLFSFFLFIKLSRIIQ